MFKNFAIKSKGDLDTIEFEFDDVEEKNKHEIYNKAANLLHKYVLSKDQNILKINISNFIAGTYISLFINESEAIAKKFIIL